jgi:hypothetical protein
MHNTEVKGFVFKGLHGSKIDLSGSMESEFYRQLTISQLSLQLGMEGIRKQEGENQEQT